MKMIPRTPNNPILTLAFIVKIIAKLIKYFLKIKIICSRGEIRTLVTCMKTWVLGQLDDTTIKTSIPYAIKVKAMSNKPIKYNFMKEI